ncbi:unnamed protein product [Trichogramma brassicae]|uniref:Uncharacterized protein n=1 Tax=Trichogramma brassicae TaxID=86971 RepID=A0A6H5IL22_9HYME|nr:unnamed protein product [Trichogramma brassicae]
MYGTPIFFAETLKWQMVNVFQHHVKYAAISDRQKVYIRHSSRRSRKIASARVLSRTMRPKRRLKPLNCLLTVPWKSEEQRLGFVPVSKTMLPNRLETLKCLHATVQWESEEQRLRFVPDYCALIADWKDELPDLRQVFERDEMDWLLAHAATKMQKSFTGGRRIVEFAAESGYRDNEPLKIGEDGKPSPLRETLLHRVDRDFDPTTYPLYIMSRLFEIYNRADVNFTDERGRTHFDIACRFNQFAAYLDFKKHGFDVVNYVVEETGDSPLHLALASGQESIMIDAMLREGADPNARNEAGATPLHVTCALGEVAWSLIEALLRAGADPNSTNAQGETPLHVICRRSHAFDSVPFVKRLYTGCAKRGLTLLINARDNVGCTPLHWAVANLHLDTIDTLFAIGADVANFSFPNETRFGGRFELITEDIMINPNQLKLLRVAHVLAVVERVRDRGYELKLEDVATIAQLFAKHELYEKKIDLDDSWLLNEVLKAGAQALLIRKDPRRRTGTVRLTRDESLSLWEVLTLKPWQSDYRFAYAHLLKFARRDGLFMGLGEGASKYRDACRERLCDVMFRRLLDPWVLPSFSELIDNRLPIELCEMIVEKFTLKDMANICQALKLKRRVVQERAKKQMAEQICSRETECKKERSHPYRKQSFKTRNCLEYSPSISSLLCVLVYTRTSIIRMRADAQTDCSLSLDVFTSASLSLLKKHEEASARSLKLLRYSRDRGNPNDAYIAQYYMEKAKSERSRESRRQRRRRRWLYYMGSTHLDFYEDDRKILVRRRRRYGARTSNSTIATLDEYSNTTLKHNFVRVCVFLYYIGLIKRHFFSFKFCHGYKMEKLRFEFVMKAAADKKSNALMVVTSITTPDGEIFDIPAELQEVSLHTELMKTDIYKKIKNTNLKRNQKRKSLDIAER